MIRKKTVLVLGAGASFPYGFPMGEQLVKHVCSELLKDPSSEPARFLRDIIGPRFNQQAVTQFGQRLLDAGRYSIDQFLQKHRDDKELAKMVIVRALVPFETDKRIGPNFPVQDPPPDRRWYRYLFDQLLTSSSGGCSLGSNNLSIVTFNFDRSFERALFLFAKANCAVDGLPGRIVADIPIYHIHGQLGAPGWLPAPDVEQVNVEPIRDYDDKTLDIGLLTRCADAIRIVDDEVEGSAVLTAARGAMAEAEQVCFLGFSYHPLNLQKLQVRTHLSEKRILGTAFEMPPGPRSAVEKAFSGVGPGGSGISLSGSGVDILQFLQNTDVLYE